MFNTSYQRIIELYEKYIITANTLIGEIAECVDEHNAAEITDAIPQHLKESFLKQLDISIGENRHKLLHLYFKPLAEEKVALWQKWRSNN